ncbi:MAG: Crp/Fnr family transcriptional regulator [Pseudomonadota bacterium]
MTKQETESLVADVSNEFTKGRAQDLRQAVQSQSDLGSRLTLERDELLKPGCYILLNGLVGREVTDSQGELRITMIFEPNDFLRVTRAQIEGAERFRLLVDGRVLRFDTAQWDRLTKKSPEITFAQMHNLERQIERCGGRIANLMGEKLPTRMARYLLRTTDANAGKRIELRQYDIARYLGVQPETVNRTIHDFIGRGLVVRNTVGLAVGDVEQLSQVASNTNGL